MSRFLLGSLLALVFVGCSGLEPDSHRAQGVAAVGKLNKADIKRLYGAPIRVDIVKGQERWLYGWNGETIASNVGTSPTGFAPRSINPAARQGLDIGSSMNRVSLVDQVNQASQTQYAFTFDRQGIVSGYQYFGQPLGGLPTYTSVGGGGENAPPRQ